VTTPEPAEIGQRVRRIRRSRGKSLDVIAGRAGITKAYLSQLETGQRSLDRLSLIVALAKALEVSPSELTLLPVPAPGNGHTDSAIQAIRHALVAVDIGRPGGQVLPVEVLRGRVTATLDTHYRCDPPSEVGSLLPGLIGDLHTSLAAGRDVAELLDLAVLLHRGATSPWLRLAGAPLDLRWQVMRLARHAAQHRETPVALGLAACCSFNVMLTAGVFDLARAELDSASVPTDTPESTQLAGTLALCRSLLAAADKRLGDVAAPLEHAAELAERTGEGNAYWLGFGPTNVAQWRMGAALETGDHETAATLAEGLHPQTHPLRTRQAAYWADYGRALARARSRRDEAVRALRQAEAISPLHVHRNPFARETLAELVVHAKQDAIGRELRGMAYRAGLPV